MLDAFAYAVTAALKIEIQVRKTSYKTLTPAESIPTLQVACLRTTPLRFLLASPLGVAELTCRCW